MKNITVITLASAGMLASASAQTDLFSTVQNWVGTGQNEAAMEFDWNEGTPGDALVWGYRWNGSATAEQMVDAIVAADPHLYGEVSGFDTGFGTDIFGLGYEQSGDGNFQLSPSLSFNSQHLAFADSYNDVNQGRTPVDAGDLWEEGADIGYWQYFVSTDSQLAANYSNYSDLSNWNYASSGISGVTLDNGDVDAFVFLDDYTDPTAYPSVPTAAPVPEPSTWTLLIYSGLTLIGTKNKWLSKKLLLA
jgi:hypothetical protein